MARRRSNIRRRSTAVRARSPVLEKSLPPSRGASCGAPGAALLRRSIASSLLDPDTHSSNSSSVAASWRPAGWNDLPADWLGYITGFLRLYHLSSSFLPVCRRWRDSLYAAPPREEWITLSNKRLAKLGDASLDLRRYVAKLSTRDNLSQESLALIYLLPQLTCLVSHIDCSEGVDSGTETDGMMQQQRRCEFPPQLTELTLALEKAVDDDGIPRWPQIECLLDAVSHVSTLTALHVTIREDAKVGGFSHIPLRTMQPLSRLSDSLMGLIILILRPVSSAGSESLSRGHIDLLRSLHQLEYLQLSGAASWSAQALEWIAEEPRMPHLRTMDLGHTVMTPAHSAVLARFTWLEHISFRLGDPTFLVNLTQLTSVDVTCWGQDDPAPGVSPLMAALSHCTRLERMRLTHRGITSEHLCALLPSLPLLADLTLMCMSSLTTLAFASSVGHLARTLTTLTIHDFAAPLISDEVRHLHALTALRELLLRRNSFLTLVDGDTIDSLKVDSPRFPRDVWPHMTRAEFKFY